MILHSHPLNEMADTTTHARILTVDDDPHVLQQVKELLTSLGYHSGILPRAEFLFQRLDVELYDLILMDVHMPMIDGLTLLKKIKEHPLYQNIPVIMLTGEVSEHVLEECFNAGATDYINKPVRPVVLSARIRAAISAKLAFDQIAVQNQQFQKDMDLAASAQQFVLKPLPELSFLKICKIYQPFGGVSGDTYDVSAASNQSVNIFLGDATGHGIDAAFITMMIQVGLETIFPILAPSIMIRQLNKLIFARIPDGNYMCASLVKIFPDGRLTFCAAGNPPLLILNPETSEVTALIQGTQAIGMFDEEITPFVDLKYQLKSGDRIFMFTDGLTEWENAQREEFGKERLIDFIQANSTLDLDVLCDNLMKYLQKFSNGIKAHDDITLLAIQYRG
ncbi:SpoIIE family protein phosphatase [Deltaproteobacteria bacterium TL4]